MIDPKYIEYKKYKALCKTDRELVMDMCRGYHHYYKAIVPFHEFKGWCINLQDIKNVFKLEPPSYEQLKAQEEYNASWDAITEQMETEKWQK